MKKKPTVIDLFSGCGGLSRGLMDAGFDVVLGVDNDLASLETFALNHGNGRTLQVDLSKKDSIDEIVRAINGIEIDLIVGGPPCQGFSLTGPRNFDDKRNSLYLAVIESVKKIKPKAFLIENVTGLAIMYGGKVKDEIIKRLSKLGYNVSVKVLCAADYGVPQMRKRVVFVGLRKDIGQFSFPEPTHAPENYVTCWDAISDLPSREDDSGIEEDEYMEKSKSDYQKFIREKATKLYNHVASKHSDLIKTIISQVPDGGNHKSLPPGVGDNRKFNEAWTRYSSKKPSKTIDTGHRNHFHYKYNRVPTVRENARLQSFPDTFKFIGSRTNQNRQVGNAVPPLLGYHLGKRIKEYLIKENDKKKKKI